MTMLGVLSSQLFAPDGVALVIQAVEAVGAKKEVDMLAVRDGRGRGEAGRKVCSLMR